MPINSLRRVFDRGLAPLFTLAAAPLLTVPGFFLPPQFFPFLLAAALFPSFFYYIRAGRMGMALWNFALWAVIIVAGLGWISAHMPHWAALHVYGGAAPRSPSAPAPLNPTPGDIGAQAGDRARDAGIVAGLAALSGGALALVAAAVMVTGFAFAAGNAIASGGDLQAAALAVEPWTLARLMALALITCGVAALFYMKIEHRPLVWRTSVRWIAWGLFLLAADVYLYFNVSHAWLTAYARSLAP